MASGASERSGSSFSSGIALEEVGGEQRNVFAAGAQAAAVDRDDVEAVEQVLAEAAFAHRLAQIDVGGGDDAHVDLDLVHPAEVHEAAVLQTRRILAWVSMPMLPISSRKSVPPLATSKSLSWRRWPR
jgi:hypothetical protein